MISIAFAFTFLALQALALPQQQLVLSPENTPVPKGYASSFFAIIAHTKSKDGKSEPVQAVHRYYDYPTKSLLNQCSVQGVTSQTLFRGKDIYVINKDLERCIYMKSFINIISPDWPVKDSEFKGIEVVNGVVSYRWNKLDHFYYEAVDGRSLVRVFAPFDQNGYSSQSDYIVYQPKKKFSDDVFAVPKYCEEGHRKNVTDADKPKFFPCYFRENSQTADLHTL